MGEGYPDGAPRRADARRIAAAMAVAPAWRTPFPRAALGVGAWAVPGQGSNEMSIGEAATALQVSVDTVRRWADSGKLASSR